MLFWNQVIVWVKFMCTGDGFLVIGSLKTLVINTCLTEN